MNVFITEPIVSVQWLKANLNASNLIVLNATIPSVTSHVVDPETTQIPKTRFFDIKKRFSRVDADFPNTFPSELQFNTEAQALGINNDSSIVIYDEKGIYSSARAWWLLKSFGHNNVAVLDGGFLEWKNKCYITENKNIKLSYLKGNFKGKYIEHSMSFYDDVLKILQCDSSIILDARSANRFKGIDIEPRKGLRSGTIPNSKNLPFKNLLKNGKLKSKSEIKVIFANLVEPDQQLYFSCGSGITACVLALAATYVGYNKCSVYDGSWTEYGSLTSK